MTHLDWRRYITSDPRICHGKPCFTGTRIMVTTVLELLEAGDTYTKIKAGYPTLRPQHLQAALQFAREAIQSGRVTAFRHARRHAIPH